VVAVVVAVVFALSAGVASAYDWQNGDVFVGQSNGKYFVYDNGGTLRETDLVQDTGAGFAVDCAFDRGGLLHTTAFSFARVVRFLDPSPHSIFTPDVTVGSFPESISFARDGSYYVGHQANPSIWHMTGSGSLITNFSPTVVASMLDLSADQKTMFYTTRTFADTKVHRYDVSGVGTELSDFASVDPADGQIADFKLLPPGDGSGGLIVAQSKLIKRLDGNGNVVQTYDVPSEDSWFGVALDPDGQSFWAQSTDGLVDRFNIASGVVDRGPLPGAVNSFGICVRGTRTAAIDNAPPSIAINTPADGSTLTQGDAVAADFSCADDKFGTGIKSCSGPVGPGQGIDTGSVGTKTFRVDASDVAGNTSSAIHSYTVVAPKPLDADGDGFPVGVDCNDSNPAIHPGAFDKPGNKIDENCDGRDAAFPRIASSITHNWIIRGPQFTAVTFKVLKVPRGATIRAICKGKGCHFKNVKVKIRRSGTANLLKSLMKKQKRRHFRAGNRLEIQITAPAHIGKDILFRFKNNLKAPGATTRCLSPGSKKPKRC
jgi:streptogramin lyase